MPKKSVYQTVSNPSSTGRFCSNGALRKCSSIAWKPSSISRNCFGPIAIIVDNPIAESIEYLPPTQSQKPNMFMTSMPNFSTASEFVDTATKCLAIDDLSCSASSTHWRAVAAFVIVSSVVNVLDDTMNTVSAGSRSRVASAKSVPSTLDTNRKVSLRSL